MAKRKFKTESVKLLDMMINSVYTHKEIFMRELISNASDALDKLYYKSLQEGNSGLKRSDFYIEIKPDNDQGTLTISDNGIGMTEKELEENLGTIAKSGSGEFLSSTGKNESIDIIGQFGVGFYSAFMVADKVTVTSRAFGSDQAYRWESTGVDGYTIEAAEKEDPGTDIVLHLKKDEDDEDYSIFLQEAEIRRLVKKYSDYIRYPVKMLVTKRKPVEETDGKKDEEPEYEEYKEKETLNSMEPIWKRPKEKVEDEEYNNYYKSKFYDFSDPARVIRTSLEGVSTFTALLFIPSHPSFDYYTKDFEKGLQLYSSGVLIMDKCKELLPDYFNFVRGIVDSQDLSLNISRETLQQNRQLIHIAKNIEKRIKRDLLSFMEEDRDGYKKFYKSFGNQLKYGLYENYGMNRDTLEDLVLFYSSTKEDLISFAEYVDDMKEDQEYIYYASGETVEKINILPQTKYIKSKGFDILYLTDDIDEFVVRILDKYKDKPFKSVQEEMEASNENEDKEASKKAEDENKDLLEALKNILEGKVSDVRLSTYLGDSAVSLSTKGGISLEMEKVIKAMPMNPDVKAERVLEINPNHPVFPSLQKAFADGGKESVILKRNAKLLYGQALLISGLSPEDPAEFAEAICDLMVDAPSC